jgi:hypothetical protein
VETHGNKIESHGQALGSRKAAGVQREEPDQSGDQQSKRVYFHLSLRDVIKA